VNKKYDIITKLIVTFFIVTMGFSSSISTPISHAQSSGISDLPFLDFSSNNNNIGNDNLKELYDMIPALNSKEDNTEIGNSDSKTGNKDAPEKTFNEKSLDSKNNDENKINDLAVYSDDAIDGIGNPSSGNEKDKEETATTPGILTSILDRLPYSDILSNSLSPYSSSPLPSSLESKMGEGNTRSIHCSSK